MPNTFAIGSLVILLSWGALGQSARPSFEVASVKPAPDATALSITPRRSGNRLTYITDVRMVIYYAYRVEPYQVSGEMPGEVFDIEAVMDGSPSEDEVRLMFQTFLEDRFRLKMHHETRPMQAYRLVVAKGGPKLKAAQDGSPIAIDGAPAPEGAGSYLTRTGPRLLGKSASMGQLADTLGRNLRIPVVDATGLAGKFDFDVAFSRDETPAPGTDPPVVGRFPSLAMAIQEQLGLRLISGKAPVEILVIDHLEPTPVGN